MTERRARSFGAVAREYDRLRPAPAPDALAWLLPTGVRTVVDLGAGTGLVTRAVADLVPDVIAVEPDERMREVLAASVADRSGVRVAAGTAEAIPLPDGVADAVVASSAWHWFDEERAIPEIARVLRPGGVLGLLWSGADRDVAWVDAVRGLAHGDQDGSAPALRRSFTGGLPDWAPFAAGEVAHFHRVAAMSREDVAAMVCTYSGVLTLPVAEQDDVRRRARTLLDERPDLAAADSLSVPFRTSAWAAVRL